MQTAPDYRPAWYGRKARPLSLRSAAALVYSTPRDQASETASRGQGEAPWTQLWLAVRLGLALAGIAFLGLLWALPSGPC